MAEELFAERSEWSVPTINYPDGSSVAEKAGRLTEWIIKNTAGRPEKGALLDAALIGNLGDILELYMAAVQADTKEVITGTVFPKPVNYAQKFGIGLSSEPLLMVGSSPQSSNAVDLLAHDEKALPVLGIRSAIPAGNNIVKIGYEAKQGERITSLSGKLQVANYKLGQLGNEAIQSIGSGKSIMVSDREHIAIVCGLTDEDKLKKSSLEHIDLGTATKEIPPAVYFCQYLTKEAVEAALLMQSTLRELAK